MSSNLYNSALNTFDIYHKHFILRTFGKERYNTKTGSILGMLTIIAIIIFSGIFLMDLFMRKNVQVLFNKNTIQIPEIDLTNVPLMFFVGDRSGKKIPSEGIYNIQVKLLNYQLDEKKINRQFSSIDIDFELCNSQKHSTAFGDKIIYLQTTGFYCILPGKQNKILHGNIGDFQNGFRMLRFYVNRCNPETEKCKEDKEINFYLSDFIFQLNLFSNSIDHYNYESPNLFKEDTGVLTMSYALQKSYYYNLGQVYYETDYGLIFEDKTTKNFFVFDSQTFDLNLPGSTYNTSILTKYAIGFVTMKCSENISFYYRSYGKAQTVLANIGGMVKAVMIICKLIFDFFTRKMIMFELSNNFFKISNCTGDKKEDFQKLIMKYNNRNPTEIKNFTNNYNINNNKENNKLLVINEQAKLNAER